MRLIVFSLMALLLVGFSSALVQSENGENSFDSVMNGTTNTFRFIVENEQSIGGANITMVIVNLQSGFTFEGGNGTDTVATLSQNGNILTWDGSPILEPGEIGEFWFEVRVSEDSGDYGFWVRGSDGSSNIETGNLTLRVNDGIAPKITVNSPKDFTIYDVSEIDLDIEIDEPGDCVYFVEGINKNQSMEDSSDDKKFSETDDFYGKETVTFFCRDEDYNWNSSIIAFTVELDEEDSSTVSTQTNETNETTTENNSIITTTTTTAETETNTDIEDTGPTELDGEANSAMEGESSLLRWIIMGALAGVGFALIIFLIFKLKSPYERYH